MIDREAADLLESAWGVIANVSNSDWTTQSAEWQEAAARWRDKYVGSTTSDHIVTPAHER